MKFVFVASIFLHISVIAESEVGAVRQHKQHFQPQTERVEDSNKTDRGVNIHDAGSAQNRRVDVENSEQMSQEERPSDQLEEYISDSKIDQPQDNQTQRAHGTGTGDSPLLSEVHSHDLGAKELKEGEIQQHKFTTPHPVQKHPNEGDSDNTSKQDSVDARRDGADSDGGPHSVEVNDDEFGEDEDPVAALAARAVSFHKPASTHREGQAAGNSSTIQMSASENAICRGSDEVKVTVSKVEGTSSTKEVSISVAWTDDVFESETGNIKDSDWSKNYDTGSITKSTHILVEIKKGKRAKNFDYKIGELLADKDDWTKKEKLTPNGHINLEFECLEKRPERCERNGQCPWNESCSDSNECEADKTDWRPRSGASMMVNYLALALSMI